MITKARLVIILLMFAIGAGSCKKQYPVPADKDINEVIAAITQNDTLPTYQNVKGTKFLVSRHLTKLKVVGPDTAVKPNEFTQVHLLLLYNSKYFNNADEKYFLFQNDILKSFLLTVQPKPPFKLTDQQIENIKKIDEETYFYELTIPIFSQDMKTAFVELMMLCYGGKCGSCHAVFLKKVNGKWTVLKKYRMWIA